MRINLNSFDIIIIGAGAAGLFAAQILLENSDKTICILNNSSKAGKKILVSGGGRCNISNAKLDYKNYFGSSQNSIKKIIKRFPPEKVIRYFEDKGVACYEEKDTHKIFPKSNRAGDILDVLKQGLAEHITVKHNSHILKIEKKEDGLKITCDPQIYTCSKLLIAVGGLSFPKTGSDGSLWKVVESLGHTLHPKKFGLSPLYINDTWLRELSGISLTATVSVRNKGKTLWANTNELLMTHSGLSGPAAMNMARFFDSKNDDISFNINFLPLLSDVVFKDKLEKYKRQHPKRSVLRFLSEYFPQRFAEKLINHINVNVSTMADLPKKDRQNIINSIYHYQPQIHSIGDENKAEITAGGVPLEEISLKTMETKIHNNIYFAGEILNVDGIIGGYNFQWAWSSAYVAAMGIVSTVEYKM